jgi:hypothetical protein
VGGRGKVAVGRSAFLTCYRTVATRHQRIFSYPRIQIAVSQFSFSSKVQQGLCISQIVILITYHMAHVKTEYKGAAPPPPFLFTPTPPPRVLYFCTISGCAQTFLFSPSLFHSSLNLQEVMVFLGNNVSGTKSARVFSLFEEDR